MDRELKVESLKVFETKRIEAVGRKAMLEKLLIDKTAEQAAELLSIQTSIVYWETQLATAEKILAKLAVEVAAVAEP